MASSSPPAASLLALVRRNAQLQPDRLAVAGPDGSYTWSELLERAFATAKALETFSLRPCDRVCLRLPSSPLWVVAFLAVRLLDLTAVSIGDRARPAELEALVRRFDVRLSLASTLEGDIHAEPVAPVGAGTPRAGGGALIHLTSGSSGAPKGVLRTEPDLTEEARNVASALDLSPGDAVLCATPVYHSFASGLLAACLHAGAPCLLMDRLAPAALLDLARRERATVIAGVPYVFQTLTALSTAAALSSLRLAVSGGAHLDRGTAARFQARFRVPLVQEYGLSEVGIVTLNLDGPPAAAGLPIPNVTVRIADPTDPSREAPAGCAGEVIVHRASPPAGYIDHPVESAETFTQHGIRSGDLGRLDAAGRLFLTGRIKSMINVAGAKVAPREVEDALLAHPAVAEAVAFAIPDTTLGEAVAAAVVPRTEIAEQTLRDHCRALLSAYKLPAFIAVLPDLPRTASGKPDLPRIRREFSPGGPL